MSVEYVYRVSMRTFCACEVRIFLIDAPVSRDGLVLAGDTGEPGARTSPGHKRWFATHTHGCDEAIGLVHD